MSYLIELKLCSNNWDRKFCITAQNHDEALSLAKQWGRYHGFTTDMMRVFPASPEQVNFYGLHNEYLR